MDLEHFFPYQLSFAASFVAREIEDVYRQEGGLARDEWRMLFLLTRVDVITSKELAQRTTLDKVQISRAAQRLEAKGLIHSKDSDSDRRLRVYVCTEAGRALFDRLIPDVRRAADAIFARMSDEDMAALRQGIGALIAVTRGKQESLPSG